MSRVFQICGLPRSGTGFLSALFNLSPRTVGFHELISTDPNWKETLAKARATWDFVADVGTYQFLRGAVIPEATKVFIDRNWWESLDSIRASIDPDTSKEGAKQVSDLAQEWVHREKPLVVNYSTLWSIASLESIWHYCFEEEERFPFEKAGLLLQMNVQRENPRNLFGPANVDAVKRVQALL